MTNVSLPSHARRKSRNTKPATRVVVLLVVVSCMFVTELYLMTPRSSYTREANLALPPKIDSTNDDDAGLPLWIQNYFAWHKDMRAKYPGKELFTDPSAPNVIVRVCLGLCGGLNDRLGQLPWDLYLANQTNRVLLIKWERPRALENFLIPNEIDWSIPADVDGFGDMHAVRAQTNFFEGMSDDRPENDFWNIHLDKALERAIHGEFKDEKILRHRLLGHLKEDELEARLKALGETDTLHYTPSFGNIFRALFRPSVGVQSSLDAVYEELHLSPGKYTAVHCRVRHPKATPRIMIVKGKNSNYPADKSGLPFFGETKDFAVSIATRAIRCARSLSSNAEEPLYFYSDSNDLVHYLAHNLKNPEFVAGNSSLFENEYDAAALKVVSSTNLLARDMSLENAHIDRQKGRDPPAYFATFVDLYLAMNARCVTYGIGFFAVFATKISGIKCKLLYQEEEWGGKDGGKATTGVQLCTEAN